MNLIKMKLAEPGLIAANTDNQPTSPDLDISPALSTGVISDINIVTF